MTKEKPAPNNDTVLVTGITGFIAKHCALALLQKGYAVRGTVRSRARAEQTKATLAGHVPHEGRLSLVEADLTRDEGWDAAAQGCRYVMHVASPFPMKNPSDRDGLLAPAREGTLRVLSAAKRSGIERAVLTSSIAAIAYGHDPARREPYTEKDWTDAESPKITSYIRAKTLAERAAWDFMAKNGGSMTLAAVNPGLVLGPALDADIGTSLEIIQMMLRGKYPAAPRLHMSIVDVRDVAAVHLAAMENPAAAGERFLCAAGSLWLVDLTKALRAALPEAARKVPRRQLPNVVVRLFALIDPSLRQIVDQLGHEYPVSHAKSADLLGIRYRSAEEAAIGTVKSLIDLGLV